MLNYASHFPLSRNTNTGDLSNSPEIRGIGSALAVVIDAYVVSPYQQIVRLPITRGRHERT